MGIDTLIEMFIKLLKKTSTLLKQFNLSLFHISVCLFVGIVGGLSISMGRPILVFAALIGLFVIISVMVKPKIGIMILVLLISSVIYEEGLPVVPLGIGSFHGTDLFLMAMLFLIPFHLTFNKNFKLVKTPLDKSLLFFYLAIIISVINGVVFWGIDFKIVMKLLRILTYYLLFFVITNFIRGKEKIMYIVKGLFIISIIVVMAMMLQAALGSSVQIMPGRIEAAKTLGKVYEATRILPPGQTLIYVMFLTAFCIVIFMKKNFLKSYYFYALFFLGIGNLLTYNRSTWISLILSIGIFALISSGHYKKRIVVWSVISIFLVGIMIFILLSIGGKPKNIIMAAGDRFGSLFSGEKMAKSDTLKWRKLENEQAINKIIQYPFFGIGLGNSFTWKKKAISYMHNFYLWLILQMGILGFIMFIWFYSKFLIRGFLNWKRIKDDILRAIYISFILSGLGFLITAFINPLFRQWFSIIIIAIMIGINEAIILYNNGLEIEVKNG